jgi:hypothetical protein
MQQLMEQIKPNEGTKYHKNAVLGIASLEKA